MTSTRNRALQAQLKRSRDDAAKVTRGDTILARIHQINQAMLGGAPDPFIGDAYGRETLHVEAAAATNLDLELVAGAPAMILQRRPDGTFPQKSNEGWTGLGQFSLDVQDIIDQMLKPGRGPVPTQWMISVEGGVAIAEVGTGVEDVVAGDGATPAWALLEAMVQWYADAAAARLQVEGKPVPQRLVRLGRG